MSYLTPENAYVFRITHRDNVRWILENGLHCRTSTQSDPNFVQIGNADLINSRATRVVPHAPGGTLGDYVPFYFTPFTPMLLNIKTGYNGVQKRPMSEIVILGSSLRKLESDGVCFVFSDRHASLAAARFSNDLQHLDRIDWNILQARDFKRDANDLEKVERYQAETLVHRTLPVSALMGMMCYDDATTARMKQESAECGVDIPIQTSRGWFF